MFFGREALIRELLANLESNLFLAIVGASGSGKSSLVRAGLIPSLRDQQLLLRVITPAKHPLESLAMSLADQNQFRTKDEIREDLINNTNALSSEADRLVTHYQSSHLLLLIDQFEELFTQCKEEIERQLFIDNLMTAIAMNGRTKIVLALRADFYARCADYEALREAVANNQKFIGSMSSMELTRTIIEPARRGGWQFQEGLVDLILRDVGKEPGRLPLLSHALRETWEQRRGRAMTLSGYTEAGRVDGAISTTAESVLGRLNDEQKSIARHIFLSLTELSENTEDTRRSATRAELASQPKNKSTIDQVLQILADARLITIDKDSIEVAHEALIREWPTLRGWINESRTAIRLRRQITKAAKDWKDNGHDKSYLYQGARLAEAMARANEQHLDLDDPARDFLVASERTVRRRRLLTLSGFVVTTALIAIVSTLALTGQLNRWIFRPLPIDYVLIEAGSFRMGSTDEEINFAKNLPNDLSPGSQYRLSNEQPAHDVHLDAYEISRYETTNKQYYQCVRAGVCAPPSNIRYSDSEFVDYPVTDVNWDDARAFCEDFYGARLPTEAQWEKAARFALNGESRIYPWGNYLPDADERDNFANVGQSNGAPLPVDSFSDNGISDSGIVNMSGNVWEWVQDWYADDYYHDESSHQPNPEGPGPRDTHTVRGGSFDNDWVQARSSYRSDKFRFGDSAFDLGFRCVRESDS